MESLTVDDVHALDHVVDFLRRSHSILFITGAGLSADSGLPTYRGVSGLYQGRDTEEDLPIESLLSSQTMASRPELTWKYLLQIEQACRTALPNRGHEVIAAFESKFERVWVLTQNVDGFHRQAGSRNVIDIHGDLHRIRCMRCSYDRVVADYAGFAIPPMCPDCGGSLRPDVVLFGEQLPARQLAIYQAEISQQFDVVFSIGTTSIFPYISAPVLDAYHWHKPIVEINLGDTDVTEFATIRIKCKAAAALDAIWSSLGGIERCQG